MHSTPISLYHLQNKGQEVSCEEGEPADKEDNQDDDERLGSIDVVSERLISTTRSCQFNDKGLLAELGWTGPDLSM